VMVETAIVTAKYGNQGASPSPSRG